MSKDQMIMQIHADQATGILQTPSHPHIFITRFYASTRMIVSHNHTCSPATKRTRENFANVNGGRI